MRHTSYISPYPVIDGREKIRVKIDLQKLEYQDTTGYYEEVRDKLKLWETKETQMTTKRYEGFFFFKEEKYILVRRKCAWQKIV